AAAGDLSDTFARLDACGAEAELIRLARSCLAPVADDRPADAGAVAGAVAAWQEGVQQRLRQAEVDRAAAEARAEERVRAAELERQAEEVRRHAAQRQVLEERRRRRLTVALAAAL